MYYSKNKQNSRDLVASRLNLEGSDRYKILINNKPLDIHHLLSFHKIPQGLDSTFTFNNSLRNSLLIDPAIISKDSFIFRDGEFFVSKDDSTVHKVLHAGNLDIIKVQGSGTTLVQENTALTSGSGLQIKESPFPICVCNTDGKIDSKQIFSDEVSEWVMGNLKEGHSGKAYHQGLVRQGSATHSDQFLRKDGQWAQPSLTYSGTVSQNFLSLNDTPISYDGNLNKLLQTTSASGGSIQFIDSSTTNITEGTNLYFTNTRCDSRVSEALTDGSISDFTLSGRLTCSEVVCSSDLRLKRDIKDLGDGAAVINKLKPKKYRFIKNRDRERCGFIAQDIQEAGLTDFINKSDTPDERLSVNYLDLIAVLVKNVQELNKKVNILEDKIESSAFYYKEYND